MWIQKVAGVTHLAYAPDGRTLYTLESNAALTAWDIATQTPRKVASVSAWSIPIERGIYPLADGRRVVSLDSAWATVFDANTGHDLGGVRSLTRHKAGLRRVTPEGRIFYIKTSSVGVGVWNLTTRDSEPARGIPKAAGRVGSFDASTDEQSVALVGLKGSVTVYDWGDGPDLQNPLALGGTANTVRFSPDGGTLALFSDRRVQMWDVSRGTPWSKPVNIDTKHKEETFAFHPTAPVFVAINRDAHLTFFGTETGAAIRSLDFALGRHVQCVAFSPDGLTCAVGGSNKQFAVFDVDL